MKKIQGITLPTGDEKGKMYVDDYVLLMVREINRVTQEINEVVEWINANIESDEMKSDDPPIPTWSDIFRVTNHHTARTMEYRGTPDEI